MATVQTHLVCTSRLLDPFSIESAKMVVLGGTCSGHCPDTLGLYFSPT